MTDTSIPFVTQAQNVNRSMVNALQDMTGVQSQILQRLAGIQQGLCSQALEAANDQLQLVGQVRDPREFASAQADLVKRHGQRYADSLTQAVEAVADAWQAYGERLAQGLDQATDQAQRTARKAA